MVGLPAGHGAEWKTIFPYSMLAIFFHSILKFSFLFHSILPFQHKFRQEAKRNLLCIFATLSVPSQVVAHEGKQYGTMHSQTPKNVLQKYRKKIKRKKKHKELSLIENKK